MKKLRGFLVTIGESKDVREHKNGAEHPYSKYQPGTVEDYKSDPEGFTNENDIPARHYSQTSMNITADAVELLFDRHDIPPSTTPEGEENPQVTVFGGYTGELADAIKECGYDVLFTDPMDEWIKRAKRHGHRTKQGSLEQLTGDTVAETDLFATFECYHPIAYVRDKIYNILRLLSAPQGWVFGESSETRAEFDAMNDGPARRMKQMMTPYQKVYGTTTQFRERDGLRIYRFYQEDNRKQVIVDGMVLAHLYILHREKHTGNGRLSIDGRDMSLLSEANGLEVERIRSALDRTVKVCWEMKDDFMKRYDRRKHVSIFDAGFTFEWVEQE